MTGDCAAIPATETSAPWRNVAAYLAVGDISKWRLACQVLLRLANRVIYERLQAQRVQSSQRVSDFCARRDSWQKVRVSLSEDETFALDAQLLASFQLEWGSLTDEEELEAASTMCALVEAGASADVLPVSGESGESRIANLPHFIHDIFLLTPSAERERVLVTLALTGSGIAEQELYGGHGEFHKTAWANVLAFLALGAGFCYRCPCYACVYDFQSNASSASASQHLSSLYRPRFSPTDGRAHALRLLEVLFVVGGGAESVSRFLWQLPSTPFHPTLEAALDISFLRCPRSFVEAYVSGFSRQPLRRSGPSPFTCSLVAMARLCFRYELLRAGSSGDESLTPAAVLLRSAWMDEPHRAVVVLLNGLLIDAKGRLLLRDILRAPGLRDLLLCHGQLTDILFRELVRRRERLVLTRLSNQPCLSRSPERLRSLLAFAQSKAVRGKNQGIIDLLEDMLHRLGFQV